VKTFLEINAINESKEGYQALKELNKVHKLELELQEIQRDVIELFDKAGKYKIDSKERKQAEEKIAKFLKEKDEIIKEMDYEKRNLRRALNSIDTEGDLDRFFE
jgi:septal ring factor EnvC (AmiA/AmiB activator)